MYLKRHRASMEISTCLGRRRTRVERHGPVWTTAFTSRVFQGGVLARLWCRNTGRLYVYIIVSSRAFLLPRVVQWKWNAFTSCLCRDESEATDNVFYSMLFRFYLTDKTELQLSKATREHDTFTRWRGGSSNKKRPFYSNVRECACDPIEH